MQEQSGSSQQTVADKLGFTSRTKPRAQETDHYGNKGILLPYETYQKTIARQLTLMYDLRDNKDYQRPSFEEWKKSRKNPRQQKWVGTEEDINGDQLPEFVVRDDRGFIQSADGLRITVPIKRQRVTKYFAQNPTKEARQEKHYKQWKDEDKPADSCRHFIKFYLSPFLKERGYTVAQVYSVIGGRIWKDNQMMKLIDIGYVAFWNSQLGEIPDDTNDDGDEIFTIPTEKDIQEARLKREEKIANEQKYYETAMAKIKARKKPIFSEGKTVESARLVPYDFQNDLDDYLIEDE
ncbi:MAG: hypothetical protein EZS28_008378 [Streblomastix strix]|uniref:Uncharacterized protein n=1 Tax=Streblomastix strix TaxID=222440 RepID=A0A5J4WN56_9EUKA|nr:MAG: hypothetical protein EZS28_008378 [Streblomastix strix]